ncbi:MAG: type 4a pilus biogenesis protein PilO [Candidatus Omnitrophica bacterium]|nr:type 4a pilus biogenesis protein PilO [Candidatus Omnitrophota bacterium]
MKIKEMIKQIQELKLDKQKIILIVVVTLVLAYLDFSFVIGMQSGSLKQLNQKISKVKSDIDNTKRELIRMQQLEGAPEKAKLVTKEFIAEEGIPMLLSEISNISNKDKIKITQIEPLKNPDRIPDLPGAANLLPVAIDLEITGGYHQLGAFLSDLENSANFIAVNQISIISQGDDYNIQRISLRLITYASG